ncbi:MBL fold metallo-hydrolase, partial [Hydrogenophaga sp.]
ADGERLMLHDGEHHSTLRVVHTPGHAANHLCLILEEDGLLFSGDHILSGSTTIIDPPDGDMSAYLDSLDRLAQACEEDGIEFILPAHGHVIGWAAQSIAQLKAHRLRREAKVLAAMRAVPQGSLDDWLPLAYDDTPAALWPLARRSLAAHVQRIEQLAML